MIFFLFFGLVAALVCGGAIIGFVLALYALRPDRLSDLLPLLDNSRHKTQLQNTAVIGLLLAAALPSVAGVSYAVSGSKWFVEILGSAGTYFWAWVAAAFSVGFVLALLLRGDGKTRSGER
jgi:CBS domain containing-hemolysin-like protein